MPSDRPSEERRWGDAYGIIGLDSALIHVLRPLESNSVAPNSAGSAIPCEALDKRETTFILVQYPP